MVMLTAQISTVFSEEDFDLTRNYFTQLTGNKLPKEKRSLLESRLRNRLNELRLSPRQYLQEVKNNSEEKARFITSLTTHKTEWFREAIHFKFLTDTLKSNENSNFSDSIKIWSAACSTGEEVYSLIMALEEAGVHRYRILGTDISDSCLKKARTGIYEPSQVDLQVPERLRKLYFLRGSEGSTAGLYRVAPQFLSTTKWRSFNLLTSDLPPGITFDFIILRNVLIYFDVLGSVTVIERLLRYLRPGGHLILGLSENLPKALEGVLERVGYSIYRRKE